MIAPTRTLRMSTPRLVFPYEPAKRLVDLGFAVAGLVLFLVLVVPVAVAIRLDSPGPVLYSQLRVGRGGRVFRMLKFRSMRGDAEPSGPCWTVPGDSRVTRVGRVLRRLHMDEVPQFVNLLRGDMSMVGPRPERPEIIDRLTAIEPRYGRRHEVKPGLAGLGYLRQGYAASTAEALERLRHDFDYLDNRSFGYDLSILIASLLKVLRCGGR